MIMISSITEKATFTAFRNQVLYRVVTKLIWLVLSSEKSEGFRQRANIES